MGYQLVRVTKEVTFGTYPSSPATGTQQDIFLPTGDAFTVRATPSFATIRDAGQGNRQVRKIPGRKTVSGGLSTYLFPAQAPFLLGLAGGLVGSNPCYDLPSFSIDHVIYTDNACATIYKRYLGCKFATFNIACDDSDNGFLTKVSGDIIGSTTAEITGTDFPIDSLSAYPADNPYEFFHTANESGQLVIGTARHDYYSLSISIKNMLVGFGGENRYTQRVAYEGRDVSFSAKLLMKSKADRDDYEAGVKKAVSVRWDNGPNTCLVDFGSVNNIDSVSDDIPQGDKATQMLSFTALVDPAISTDMTITTT